MRLYHEFQGRGRPLVLLHGFLGSSDNWRNMRKRFEVNYRVLSVDLRNHGHSPHSDTMNYIVMVEDLHQLLSEQGLSNIFLIGHSMGGKVALQLAAHLQAQIDRLVIVDIAPKAYPPSHRPLLQAMQRLDLGRLTSYGEAEVALALAVPDPSLRKFLVKNLARDSNGNFRWRIGLDSLAANYDQLIKAPDIPHSFDKPICFIRGACSRFIEDQDLATIRDHFHRAEFHTIANAGHWVHIDAPDEFYRVVDEFFRRP